MLSDQKLKQVHHALLDAFPTRAELAQVVRFGLGKHINTVTTTGTLSEEIFQLLEWSEAHHKTRELLRFAIDANPTNEELGRLTLNDQEYKAANELLDEIQISIASQPGILQTIVNINPGLINRLALFLEGTKRLLIVGGESANGKSLLVAELALQYTLVERMQPTPNSALAIISYDRIHQLFLYQLGERIGMEIQPPVGETHPRARRLISYLMRDTVLFALSYLSPSTRVIMEAPLLNQRGEIVLDHLYMWKAHTQVLFMHSPETWRRVLHEGTRISKNSGQVPAMKRMRAWRLERLGATSLSISEQDRALHDDWVGQLAGRDGMVVSWDPRDNEHNYQLTVQRFRQLNIRPDILGPDVLQQYVSSVTDSILSTLPDVKSFAAQITSYEG